MRTLLLAMATAVGIGVAGTSATLGAAATGSALTGQPATETLVVKVGHCRYSRWRPWCGGHGWRWSRRRW